MKKLFSEIPYLHHGRIILKRLTEADAPALQSLAGDQDVYRYLPTFLFEKKYPDAKDVIRRLYDECLEESLILGIFANDSFCGLTELYGFRDRIRKISVGYRLAKAFWGQGIATEALSMILDFLQTQTNIEIITASSMIENHASAKVLRKNDFELVIQGSKEDWGFEQPVLVNKWIR